MLPRTCAQQVVAIYFTDVIQVRPLSWVLASVAKKLTTETLTLRRPYMALVDEEVIVKAKSTLAPTSNPVPQTSMLQGQSAVNHSNAEAIEVLCMDNPALPTTGESGGTMDIQSLCLSQDFKSMAEVEKVVTSVPFCKPDKEWFFRVHPQFTWFMAVLSEKKENYVVDPKLLPELGGEAMKKMVVLGVTRQGMPFFWPLKIEAERGLDEWSSPR
jgi:hypothetical protein